MMIKSLQIQWPISFICLGIACATGPKQKEPPPPSTASLSKDTGDQNKDSCSKTLIQCTQDFQIQELQSRLAQFAPAELKVDLAKLPNSEQKALNYIVDAAKLMDPIFDRQAYKKNIEIYSSLANHQEDELKQLRLQYFNIMRCPWDRQKAFEPFIIDSERPLGAGFYPENLTREQLQQYFVKHPDQRLRLEDLLTLVEYSENSTDEDIKLIAKPYHEAYAEWLIPAQKALLLAAQATQNTSLQTFLKSRAQAFMNDEYRQSDKDWMDLDSLVEVTIGPYETYEDNLLGLKASYEAFVTIQDPVESKKLERLKALLPEMEKHLPKSKLTSKNVKVLNETRGNESPIRVVDLVYTSGDARKSVQTIAFNLPNDEIVRKEKGAKKVLLRNLIEAKFEKILRPIGIKVLAPEHIPQLSKEAFFQQVLYHELSHSLGPGFTLRDKKKVEIRVALGPYYSALEEAKADVVGIYSLLFTINKGWFPKEFREAALVSYFVGLFRSVRFGVHEAHGQGAALQINRYFDAHAVHQGLDGKLVIDTALLEEAVKDLATDLLDIQRLASQEKAESFLKANGTLSSIIESVIQNFEGVPIDIRPVYSF